MKKPVVMMVIMAFLSVGQITQADTLPVSSDPQVPLYWDTASNKLGIGTTSPTDAIHVDGNHSGNCNGNDNIRAIRIVNPGLASCPDAQEQFVLGPAGQEHLMIQVLSDVNPVMPKVALLNAYTNDLYIRTNAKNIIKTYRAGAEEATLVLKTGRVGVGTEEPSTKLHIAGDTIRIDTPRAGTGNCNVGEITWDTGYIYVCVQPNTWKKAQLQ